MEENKNINQQETCWAYDKNCQCMILTELVCSKKWCNFYKTKQQFEADAKKYESNYPY